MRPVAADLSAIDTLKESSELQPLISRLQQLEAVIFSILIPLRTWTTSNPGNRRSRAGRVRAS